MVAIPYEIYKSISLALDATTSEDMGTAFNYRSFRKAKDCERLIIEFPHSTGNMVLTSINGETRTVVDGYLLYKDNNMYDMLSEYKPKIVEIASFSWSARRLKYMLSTRMFRSAKKLVFCVDKYKCYTYYVDMFPACRDFELCKPEFVLDERSVPRGKWTFFKLFRTFPTFERMCLGKTPTNVKFHITSECVSRIINMMNKSGSKLKCFHVDLDTYVEATREEIEHLAENIIAQHEKGKADNYTPNVNDLKQVDCILQINESRNACAGQEEFESGFSFAKSNLRKLKHESFYKNRNLMTVYLRQHLLKLGTRLTSCFTLREDGVTLNEIFLVGKTKVLLRSRRATAPQTNELRKEFQRLQPHIRVLREHGRLLPYFNDNPFDVATLPGQLGTDGVPDDVKDVVDFTFDHRFKAMYEEV